jgi:AcrR family transcriptional regulator
MRAMTAQIVDNRAAPRQPRGAPGQTRRRLLAAGLRLFAERGFANTSTREIAEAAQVNVASIAYYFGDKAGLYRAAFFEPLGVPETPPADDVRPAGLDDALQALFAELLAPLREGELARLCVQLHFREMVEPTGLWAEEIEREIRPMNDRLVRALCDHLGLDRPDDEVRRLALMIAGLGVHLHVGRDVIQALAPALSVTPDSVDSWMAQLHLYAKAMVEAESRRRQGLPAPGAAYPAGGHADAATAPSPVEPTTRP